MPDPRPLDDAALTGVLGPKCPHCGWRGGRHRPPIDLPQAQAEACPEWRPDRG